MNIAITGATGFLARHLIPKLQAAGHHITTLGRRPVEHLPFVPWDAAHEPPDGAFESCDAVIHLAGETVAQRWTTESKRRIYASRVDGTRHLVQGLMKTAVKPRVLLAASAVGVYGSRANEVLTETSAPGSGFLAALVVDWEAAARGAEPLGIRVVNLRFGVILGSDGGAYPKMLAPFKFGAGGRLGSGAQWMPWIHVEDATRLVVFALESDAIRGPLNVTAPNPVTNEEFTRKLAAAIHRPSFLSVPAFALKLALGEMAGAALDSERVLPAVAQATNFHFDYPELDAALRHLTRH